MESEEQVLRILNAGEIFIITNALADDNPIIYVDSRFLNYTGYEADDFIGRNCRFLQRGNVSIHSLNLAKEIINSKTERVFTVINFKRDGTRFLNSFKVKVFLNADGIPSYFVGTHIDFVELKD